jgi:hypothetical protein
MVVEKSVSHPCHHSAWQWNERCWVYGDTGILEMDWAMAGAQRYRGHRYGLRDGKDIFG